MGAMKLHLQTKRTARAVYIETRREGDTHELRFGLSLQPSPPNTLAKTLTAAVIAVAVGLAFWGLVLTDIGPMQ